jgi:ABC-type molybdate transport system substrate-binding protein
MEKQFQALGIADQLTGRIYTAAILTTNANMAAARAFLQMLASAEGAAVLKRAGLEPLSGAR